MNVDLGLRYDQSTSRRVAPLNDGLLAKRSFPTWHFAMMNDVSRTQAIEHSIRDAGVTDKTVFEIGTGAGLTAMLFARHGARHIYTCEVDRQLYDVAREAIRTNGLEKRITIFPASSTEIVEGGGIDVVPDVVFTETLDCGVVGEGFFSIANDIHRIAGPDTIILPSLVVQYGYLVNSDDIRGLNVAHNHSDLDLSPINGHSTSSYYPVRLPAHASRSLSSPCQVRKYSYGEPQHATATFRTAAYRDGMCHGLLSYFHAFYGNHVISNDIRDGGHWHQAFHPLATPFLVKAGHVYGFNLGDDGSLSVAETKES